MSNDSDFNEDGPGEAGEPADDGSQRNAEDARDGNAEDAHDGNAAAEAKRADSAAADLPELLKNVGRLMRHEFFAAAADGGVDPREFGRLRRSRWWADDYEDVADGAPGDEEPVRPDSRGHHADWHRGAGRGADEFRERIRSLRDEVGTRVEEVLGSEEFEALKASLEKIAEGLGRDASQPHGHREHSGPCGHDDPHPREDGRGRRRGFGPDAGRGRRGFGPNFGSGRPGFGPFGPFAWSDDRSARAQEVQEAFERGFAAGFEQGSRH